MRYRTKDVVVGVLARAGKQMHYKVVTAQVQASGLCQLGGETPWQTVKTHLMRDARVVHGDYLGYYRLRDEVAVLEQRVVFDVLLALLGQWSVDKAQKVLQRPTVLPILGPCPFLVSGEAYG